MNNITDVNEKRQSVAEIIMKFELFWSKKNTNNMMVNNCMKYYYKTINNEEFHQVYRSHDYDEVWTQIFEQIKARKCILKDVHQILRK